MNAKENYYIIVCKVRIFIVSFPVHINGLMSLKNSFLNAIQSSILILYYLNFWKNQIGILYKLVLFNRISNKKVRYKNKEIFIIFYSFINDFNIDIFIQKINLLSPTFISPETQFKVYTNILPSRLDINP